MSLITFLRRQRITTPKPVVRSAAATAQPSVSTPAAGHEPAQRSHAEIMVVISALLLVMLLAALDQTIVSTALPTIANQLHGLSKYSWVATAYLLTSAISTPIYGKISDMFGRKKILQTAIAIFLVGSILCGVAQTMNQLIVFRGLQGLGAGGLMTLVFAVIGDIVPPRERGKYQGYFVSVFGVSSVIGPLLGGLLTDHLSWRWVFFVNIPVGIVAAAAIAARLHIPVKSSPHKVDWTGAGLLAVAISTLLLGTVWGGVDYPWGSAQIIGLFIAAVISTALFIWRETKAAEPIISMGLFKSKVFKVITVLSTLVGVVMFGAIIFIPEYQQIVRGDSATASGLRMLPLVLGIMSASITSGRLISKFGRYRKFPILGSVILTIALALFSQIAIDTSRLALGIWMYILGFGIGFIMPVLTLAAQNAVERKDLGSATSTVVFFRSIGSTLGAAIFGAILTNRLAAHLTQQLPGADGASLAEKLHKSAAIIKTLPPTIQHQALLAFARSFHDVFLIAIPFAVVAFIVTLFLEEAPLKSDKDRAAEAPVVPID